MFSEFLSAKVLQGVIMQNINVMQKMKYLVIFSL